MANIAKNIDVNRQSLYKSLSPGGNPSFGTVAKVLDNLGFQLSIKQKLPA
jgi:probable addiction module antidote protein